MDGGLPPVANPPPPRERRSSLQDAITIKSDKGAAAAPAAAAAARERGARGAVILGDPPDATTPLPHQPPLPVCHWTVPLDFQGKHTSLT